MSKKRRRNQIEEVPAARPDLLNLSSANVSLVAGTTESISSGETRRSNKIAYLKTNWLLIGIIAFLSLGAFGAGMKYLEDAAKLERASNKPNDSEQSLFSKLNPFTAAPVPTATPTPLPLSKEYIYAGSKLLAVEDAGANAAPPTDLAIWRPSTGTWWVLGGQGSQQVSQGWGTNGDIPVQGDYDGDGKTDFSVFRPSNNTWYIVKSSDSSSYGYGLGSSGDKPAAADFDGDGKTDIAVYRPSNGTWYIAQSSTQTTVSQQLGLSTDDPAPADFDGDGKADITVWRSSNTTFYTIRSSNGQLQYTAYGSASDKPVCADYDGDGKADIAVWRSSNATWYVYQSTTLTTVSSQFGISSDIPVQNDYDGDGKVDMALWRAVASGGGGDVGRWYILQSSNSQIRQETWGISDDIPVPALYRR